MAHSVNWLIFKFNLISSFCYNIQYEFRVSPHLAFPLSAIYCCFLSLHLSVFVVRNQTILVCFLSPYPHLVRLQPFVNCFSHSNPGSWNFYFFRSLNDHEAANCAGGD